ncbi:MAG: hypothetical protein JWN14_1939 [Chthonomonadales bacterium]|nr:hypothetical protein [Chthonomonadales bacterium]
MVVSRRNFLVVSTALLYQEVASAKQITRSAHFRFTVWTIRPLVKRAPTPEELKRDSRRWLDIQGLCAPEIGMAEDHKILEALRKRNPLLTIPRIEQKSAMNVSADTLSSVVLNGGMSFEVAVKVDGRETALTDLAQTHGKAMADEFRQLAARDTMIYTNIRIPVLDASLHPTSGVATSKGYRAVKPGLLYAVNPNLSYLTTLAHPEKPGISGGYMVRQRPNDIVFFCMEPLTQKGERK